MNLLKNIKKDPITTILGLLIIGGRAYSDFPYDWLQMADWFTASISYTIGLFLIGSNKATIFKKVLSMFKK